MCSRQASLRGLVSFGLLAGPRVSGQGGQDHASFSASIEWLRMDAVSALASGLGSGRKRIPFRCCRR